jgi:hypothetical protein
VVLVVELTIIMPTEEWSTNYNSKHFNEERPTPDLGKYSKGQDMSTEQE